MKVLIDLFQIMVHDVTFIWNIWYQGALILDLFKIGFRCEYTSQDVLKKEFKSKQKTHFCFAYTLYETKERSFTQYF